MAPPTTNLKKFKCEICPNKAYTAQSNLCTHYRSAHPDEPTPSFRTEKVKAEQSKTELSDIKELILKLASGELTTEALVKMAGIEIQEPVTPTLDIGHILSLDLRGLTPDEVKERQGIIYDHIHHHLHITGVYDEVYKAIKDEDYDVAFYKAFKNQLFCDKGVISYMDDGEIEEMEQSEVNVCTLFKLLCDTIMYVIINQQQALRDAFESWPDSVRDRFELMNGDLDMLSSSISIKGNGRVIVDPRSDLTSRTATRSLSISYHSVKKCLVKFNHPLEI
jgi:hypothetical protein